MSNKPSNDKKSQIHDLMYALATNDYEAFNKNCPTKITKSRYDVLWQDSGFEALKMVYSRMFPIGAVDSFDPPKVKNIDLEVWAEEDVAVSNKAEDKDESSG